MLSEKLIELKNCSLCQYRGTISTSWCFEYIYIYISVPSTLLARVPTPQGISKSEGERKVK